MADNPGQRQQELREDVDAVLEYATRFPDTWTGLRFDGDRLVVLFTDPGAHRTEIAALVAHPDRVEVLAARRSEREVRAIVAEVGARLASSAGRWSNYGPGLDTVSVRLHGDAEDIARDLHLRFGDAVELTVGAHRYPFMDPPPSAPQLRAPRSTLVAPTVGLRAIPDSGVVVAGQLVTGRVECTNTAADGDLAFDTGQPLNGQLLDGDHVVSTTTGFSASIGLAIRLGPGRHTAISFLAGTDSRDLRYGPTLPPGRYQLIVTVPVYSLAGAGRQRNQRLVTPPTPIDVIGAVR